MRRRGRNLFHNLLLSQILEFGRSLHLPSIDDLGATCADGDAHKSGVQQRSVNVWIPPGIEYGHAYTCHACGYTGHKRDNRKYSLQRCVLDSVHTPIVSDIVRCKDGPGVRKSGNGTASDEERLEMVGADIGYETFQVS